MHHTVHSLETLDDLSIYSEVMMQPSLKNSITLLSMLSDVKLAKNELKTEQKQ